MAGPLLSRPIGAPLARPGSAVERLIAAGRLASALAPLRSSEEIAHMVAAELHHRLAYEVAAVERLDPDGFLRLVAAADAATWEGLDEQSADRGLNGRAARTGESVLVADTSAHPDVADTDAEPRSRICVPIPACGTTWGVLSLEAEAEGLCEEDLVLAESVAAQAGAAIHRALLFTELEHAFVSTLGVLSEALESSELYTAAHPGDVADLAVAVGTRLGLDANELRAVRYTALLHDIGKASIRSEVLDKPGRLSAGEFDEIAQHTIIGQRMLAPIAFFRDVHPLVRSAHERWDGSGYPDGLAGEEIPVGARIVGACDAYHAMTSNRPWRRAMSVKEAREELRANAGTQFCPAAVEALLEVLFERDEL